MPDPGRFDKGFNLENNSKFGKYIIASHSNVETAIRSYQEYSYNITIKFINNRGGVFTFPEINDLKNVFESSISSDRIIYTAYGNPYNCSLRVKNSYTDGVYYVFECEGHAYRVYN